MDPEGFLKLYLAALTLFRGSASLWLLIWEVETRSTETLLQFPPSQLNHREGLVVLTVERWPAWMPVMTNEDMISSGG